ncbi:MAG: histidinol-phosphatase HisJ family protein [Firmicutes bacterium]|nr:histidinol-phosphatase HisJ family protein [Bacillota bacterium]
MFDFHMHSTISFDGQGSPEAMAAAAAQAGLREICFTDHVDDDPRGIYQDSHFSLERYAASYDHLRVPGLTIRLGMEFGMLPDNPETVRGYLAQRDFDFIIGSVHFADGEDVYFVPYWQGKTVHQAERRYLENVYACVQAHTDFDVLGHLTYLSKARFHPARRCIPLEEHREIVDAILRELVRKGKGLEINSSGVDRCGDFLPGEAYLRRFRELGGQIVTVGSDAHSPDRVGQYMPRACELAGEIFGYVCTFHDRQPVFHKIP